MKKLLTLAALLVAGSLSYGQGYISWVQNSGTSNLIKTNGATATGNAGGASGSAWYYELLVAPTTTTTIDASLNGWTAVAFGANTLSGRMNGNSAPDGSSVQIAGYGATATANFAVVGWSANLGTDFNAVYAGRPGQLASGVGGFGNATWANVGAMSGGAVVPVGAIAGGAWYGISPVASNIALAPSGGPYNGVFGPATAGLIPGFTMSYYAVPEPGTLALAGLGAAAMLIFRRRK